MSWFWLALSAAVLWGLGYTFNQITLKKFSALELLFFESVLISIVIFIYFLWKENFSNFLHKLANPKQLALISGSSIIFLIASLLIFKSIKTSNAGLAAIIEASYPIFTVIFAYLILGESQLNPISAIGFALVIAGIIIIKQYA